MARLERDTPHGRLVVVGRTEAAVAAAADLARAELAERRSPDQPSAPSASTLVENPSLEASAGLAAERLERIPFLGEPAWFKRSWLRGGARVRWTVKSWIGARVPRVAEFHNLSWLRERLFEAPAPIAAGFVSRSSSPAWQFLLTSHVPDATSLDAFLDDRSRADRAAVLEEVARETARLHALGFVHHDLYPRNLLVRERDGREAGARRRVVFLDAWAGGPPPQSRDAAYDLACFLLRADTQLTSHERRAFLESYAAHRAAQARPIDERRTWERARAIRRSLVDRLERRPHERRGLPLPHRELQD